MHDGALDYGVIADSDVAPEGAVGADGGTRADHTVVADDCRAGEGDTRVDFGALAHPDAGPERKPVDVDVDLAIQDVLMRAEVGLERPDVLPVAIAHVAIEAFAGSQRRRERLTGEVHGLALGDEVEDLGLEHVDPGVDCVAEHLAPRGLFQEPFDRAVLVGDDDAELQRVLDRLEGQGGQSPVAVVEVHHLAQVDVGEDVAGDDEEPLVELVHGVSDGARRAERGGLGGVHHADAELGAVAEVGPDGVGHEGHRDDDVLEPVGAEQVDHVLHHRDVGHRQHRLGLVRGERAQAGALASGHDHCLHQFVPISSSPSVHPHQFMLSGSDSPRGAGRRPVPCVPPGRRTRRRSMPA